MSSFVDPTKLGPNSEWLFDKTLVQYVKFGLLHGTKKLEVSFQSRWSSPISQQSIQLIKGCVRSDFRRSLISRGKLCSLLIERFFRCMNLPFKDAHRLGTISLFRANIFHLSLIPNQLCNQLVKQIKMLYRTDSLDERSLIESFKQVLSEFHQRQDIKPIDIFAILNSLRKTELSFLEDSKVWTFCFFRETSIRCGMKRMTLSVTLTVMFDIFTHLYNLLDPMEKDLFGLMYLEIFRNPSFWIYPPYQEFELTIEKPYSFWRDLMNWEKMRQKKLVDCANSFIRRPFFTKKNSRDFSFIPKSFTDFFSRLQFILLHSQTDDLRKLKYNKLNFDI
jgi:hypothetical protein